MTDPTPEHEWLQRLVGDWTYENECVMGPNGETEQGSGREVVRAFGGLWTMGETTGTMPGCGEMSGLMTLGYDPVKGKYVGSWIGTPMAYMFVYEGSREGDVLTLDCEGPSFENPAKMAKYQDVVELRGPNERELRSQVRGADGSWQQFMQGVYTRA